MTGMPHDIEAHPTPWRQVILACGKCGKKLDGGGFGPGGKDTLPQALKLELRSGKRRRDVRVIETKCLGLCPKDAVAVLLARKPGEILVVAAGTPVAVMLDRLVQPDQL